jgi:hypothetical protein
LIGVFGAVGVTARAEPDPGLLIDLDRIHYRVSVWDLRSGQAGPTVPVVLGSPANPTPTGSYPLSWVILVPAWHPGPAAIAAGARPEAASTEGPMGVAKIPFAQTGSIALHGGGNAGAIGQPISGGCVRAGDSDLLRIIAWLDLAGFLGPAQRRDDGEIYRPFQRPARIVVH